MSKIAEGIPATECVVTPPVTENLKNAKWRLAVDLVAQTPDTSADSHVRESGSCGNETRGAPSSEQVLESRLHAVERVPSEGRGKPAQFVPIHFVFSNKLTKDDRLLLAFDALVLSQVLGREVSLGDIIHGDDPATLKVKTAVVARAARKCLEKIAALLSNPAPPQLVLNRHCAECEFEARCRQKALEQDDLSLLPGMSAKEREKLRSKGIFTVTQLSYNFRPRRRPKRLRDKRERYHHSLKALAIREKKIHIVGSPELKIEGTPVYLDVEGVPDRDFYYLIGVRIGNGESAVQQHSLWADTVADEEKIWRQFLGILATVEKPILIHYGSYETIFLRLLSKRFGGPPEGSASAQAIRSAVNLLAITFSQVYFPTYSNGLKEIAGWLGFKWTDSSLSGKQAIACRESAQHFESSTAKGRLVTYNLEDCDALALLALTITRLSTTHRTQGNLGKEIDVVRTDDLKPPLVSKWREFVSPLSEFEFVNKAAHWDYQRDRIYVRTSERLKRSRATETRDKHRVWRVDKVVREHATNTCPNCNRKGVRHGVVRSKTVQELLFGRFSLKRRFIRYEYQPYWCAKCKAIFGIDRKLLKRGKPSKYSKSLLSYIFYQAIELFVPVRTVARGLSRLFGLNVGTGTMASFKNQMAEYYSQTHQRILERVLSGHVVHADETNASIKGKRGYVWVFTNMHEVAYLYCESREGELVENLLGKYKGVLVSDFYAVYDSLDCAQQKCLIHLVRDLNGVMLDNPYDEELKHIVRNFGQLLKTIVEDVDRHGLKQHFLRKHLVAVDRFYRKVVRAECQSPAALACRDRFEKNRDKLFTFLKFDGVPWNNNNAEHAIKAFARLRDVIEGSSTEKGIREYLVLLSICQTCKYMGVDFLDFLRSGAKDIQAFAESRRRRQTQASHCTPQLL
jgi:predicted RecB family nuclease